MRPKLSVAETAVRNEGVLKSLRKKEKSYIEIGKEFDCSVSVVKRIAQEQYMVKNQLQQENCFGQQHDN